MSALYSKGHHHSVRRCYPTIRLLLDQGVDVRIVGEEGKTLLDFAAALDKEEEDALEVVKLLVHAGNNPSALNSTQKIPLHIAAQRGCISVDDYFLSLDMAFPPDVLLAASNGYSK